MPQLNGTLVLSTSDTIKGNIVLAPLSNPPNDAVLEFQNQGAIAVVMEGFPDACKSRDQALQVFYESFAVPKRGVSIFSVKPKTAKDIFLHSLRQI
jgi:hypothetical protein